MFAIAFDLVVSQTQVHHPKGVAQAYSDIRDTLSKFEFDWVQGSLYVSNNEDLAKLFSAIMAFAEPVLVSTCRARHTRLPRRTMVRLHPVGEGRVRQLR